MIGYSKQEHIDDFAANDYQVMQPASLAQGGQKSFYQRHPTLSKVMATGLFLTYFPIAVFGGNGGNFAGGNYTPEPKDEQTETTKKNDSKKKSHPWLTAIIAAVIIGGIAALANDSGGGNDGGRGSGE